MSGGNAIETARAGDFMRIYCLDNSEAAALSEDFLPNRWEFQLQALGCLSKAAARALVGGQHAVLGTAAKPQLLLPPSNDRASLYQLKTIQAQPGTCLFFQGLKLALLTSKRSNSSRVLSFLASTADLSEAQALEVAQNYKSVSLGLDIVLLCEEFELSSSTMAALHCLVGHLNSPRFDTSNTSSSSTDGSTKHSQTTVPPACRLVFLPASHSTSFWHQMEVLLSLDEELDSEEYEDDPEFPDAAGRPFVPPPRGSMPASTSPASKLPTQPSVRLRRSAQPSTCRYESLDSLQHLSADGMLRSWLPSYANVPSVFAVGATSNTQPKYCYISVYKIQLPKWHKILSVSAGRVACRPARAAAPKAGPLDDAEELAGRESEAFASPSAGTGSRPGVSLEAEPRRGTLTLIASTDSSSSQEVRLLWSSISSLETPKAYTSIFESDPCDTMGDVDQEGAELNLLLSRTRTRIRCLPGSKILEVEVPGSSSSQGGSEERYTVNSGCPGSQASRYFFWLQQNWSEDGLSGTPGLAEKLIALVEDPPEFDLTKHANRLKCTRQPTQLGPLPMSLVEEIARANGKEVLPDGSITRIAAMAAEATSLASSTGASSNQRSANSSSSQTTSTSRVSLDLSKLKIAERLIAHSHHNRKAGSGVKTGSSSNSLPTSPLPTLRKVAGSGSGAMKGRSSGSSSSSSTDSFTTACTMYYKQGTLTSYPLDDVFHSSTISTSSGAGSGCSRDSDDEVDVEGMEPPQWDSAAIPYQPVRMRNKSVSMRGGLPTPTGKLAGEHRHDEVGLSELGLGQHGSMYSDQGELMPELLSESSTADYDSVSCEEGVEVEVDADDSAQGGSSSRCDMEPLEDQQQRRGAHSVAHHRHSSKGGPCSRHGPPVMDLGRPSAGGPDPASAAAAASLLAAASHATGDSGSGDAESLLFDLD